MELGLLLGKLDEGRVDDAALAGALAAKQAWSEEDARAFSMGGHIAPLLRLVDPAIDAAALAAAVRTALRLAERAVECKQALLKEGVVRKACKLLALADMAVVADLGLTTDVVELLHQCINDGSIDRSQAADEFFHHGAAGKAAR